MSQNLSEINQYEFAFPSDFTDELVTRLGLIVGIPINLEPDPQKSELIRDYDSPIEVIRVMKSPHDPECFIMVKYNKKDWLYQLVIRVRVKVSKEVEEFLREISLKIEDEYGHNPTDTIKNVIDREDTFLNKYLSRHNIDL
ncbi:hypothetical protein [Paenibacillus qinlingensis]|uniref:Uncharacterized protein n=1 Tax=Paenibacillus qinlingensis TaxID=1837343 RepID=A0ABU1NVS4_9BACL|nr:hypothetical protein [Paenibacillus qinlingensis]MDR6551558.1 hypothetical protein [Paenibacillus qinlingensis]